jgi:hypothetical protein
VNQFKSQAERDRGKEVAWSRAKSALQEFLLRSLGCGTPVLRKRQADAVMKFISEMEAILKQ